VEAAEGLDEFDAEAERSLIRIEPPGTPVPDLWLRPDQTFDDTRYAAEPRFDWTRHANSVAIATLVLIAAVSGVLLLKPFATPPQADDSNPPTIEAATPAPSRDPVAIPAWTTQTPPSGSPSVETPVPREAITAASGSLPGARMANRQGPDNAPGRRIVTPSAALARSATRPAPPPRVVTVEAPAGTPATAPERTSATAASPSLAAAPTPAPPSASIAPPMTAPAALPSPPETLRPPSPEAVHALAVPTGRDLDARAIENVLGRYRSAFNALDAGAAATVWPKVNQRNLARAFERLEDQELSFESCKIDVGGVHAEAACDGFARYVQKVGSRTPKAEARQWRFILRRASEGWVIDSLDAR
jgi:hypothetical protein